MKMEPAMPMSPANPTRITRSARLVLSSGSQVPMPLTSSSASWVTPTKRTVSNSMRRMGLPSGRGGFSLMGSSRVPSTVISMVTRKESMRMMMTSQNFCLSMSGEMSSTSAAGSISITDLMPEARPRCCSGTISGINPCCPAWLMLEENCSRMMPSSSTASDAVMPKPD